MESTERKVAILADAAKYDASCSTSGSDRANSGKGMGTGAIAGICHVWSADGRCVALLKVLFSNACAWDCAYCAKRRSADVPRASFSVEELAKLALDFYKRNYIEGLFLSSGVIGCPDSTMERLVAVARLLRRREGFSGYIHMKIIPGCSPELALEACRWADRVSVNIELASAASLARLAPDKAPHAIFAPMRAVARAIAAHGGDRQKLICGRSAQPTRLLSKSALDSGAEGGYPVSRASAHEARYFAPAGQTTQMLVGARPETDRDTLILAENLYRKLDIRRVYYSAYIPVGDSARLSAARAPLRREHRLYQADWLFRFYGFSADEVLPGDAPFLDPSVDPKAAWALRNMAFFPVDAMSADYEALLRVPGLGPLSAKRIIKARRYSRLGEAELKALGVVMRRARWFLASGGKALARIDASPAILRPLMYDRGADSGQLEFDWGGRCAGSPNVAAPGAASSASERPEAAGESPLLEAAS